jgi:hypothetical protein
MYKLSVWETKIIQGSMFEDSIWVSDMLFSEAL